MKYIFYAIITLIALFWLSPFIFLVIFFGKIYPGLHINQIDASGKTPEHLIEILSAQAHPQDELSFKANVQNSQLNFKIPLKSIDFQYDFEKTAERAYNYGRSGNPLLDATNILNALIKSKVLGLSATLSEEKLAKNIATIAASVNIDPVYPEVNLGSDSTIIIEPGEKGSTIDTLQLRSQIANHLSHQLDQAINIPLIEIDPSLNQTQTDNLYARAEKFIDTSIQINYKDRLFEINDKQIVNLLSESGYQDEKILEIVSSVEKQINQDPADAKFTFENGRVKEFAPAIDGLRLDSKYLKEELIVNLAKIEKGEEKHLIIEPKVTVAKAKLQNSDVNNLGINELIGRGSSRFVGSISSRLYNINLAASRLNGVLVAPGEMFSFNTALGDVSKFTGFKEAYVIRDGQTVLGDGGGVCQVSTTLFRAAMNAGLPIIERRAHSYRVGYYEQDQPAGLDATVFAPTTDLKFKNDTPGHILIKAYPDMSNYSLIFEIYGSSDGRVATISKPIISGVTPPPEDLYIDDPSLPQGEIKQIDYKAWGAKSQFDYSVERDGQIIYQKTFYSNYKAWQAKFLRGTGPII